MDYSILLADDEALIREGFIARLRHMHLEPVNVYEAANGEEALECVSRHYPEIVVTDIRMPAMEGLELIRRAKELAPETEFIILSGYAEFAYAEQAIKMGVHAYLVKPLSNGELGRVMGELFKKLDAKRRIAAALKQADAEDFVVQEWLLEKQVSKLLAGSKDAPSEPLASFLRRDNWFAVALAHIEIAACPGGTAGGQDIEAALDAARRCFREQQEAGRALLTGNPSDRSQCYLLFRGSSPEGVSHYAGGLLHRMQRQLRREADIVLTVGVSVPARSLSCKEARQAKKALCQRITRGSGETFFYGDLPHLNSENFPKQELAMLQRSLERRDLGGIEKLLREMFGRAHDHDMPSAYLRLLWMRVANLILNTAGMPHRMELDRYELDYDEMKRFASVDDMRAELFSLISDAVGSGHLDDMDSLSKIRMSVQYIGEHYGDELSANEMAEMYTLSPNYFSTLFHRETGTTVINYIKNVRIERACELLRTTDDSVVEIARLTGYADSQYFFRVFKKQMGSSPLQYRKRCREM